MHHGAQPSASQVRTFNLVVSQNGEASLTPIRQHYAQAHQAAASGGNNSNNGSVLCNKQQKGGGGGGNVNVTDPNGLNQPRRMQSTAPRLFSYKPKINEMKGSPFL